MTAVLSHPARNERIELKLARMVVPSDDLKLEHLRRAGQV